MVALEQVDARELAERLGEEALDVLLDHVKDLGGNLDTGRTATADYDREQAAALLLRLGWQRRDLEVVHQVLAQVTRVLDCLEAVAVVEALDAVRVGHTADGNHELVVRDVNARVLACLAGAVAVPRVVRNNLDFDKAVRVGMVLSL